MQRRKFVVRSLAILLSGMLSTAVVAQSGLPLSGVVTKMTPSVETVTIGKQVFKMRPGVRVVDSKGQPANKLKPNELKKGTYVEFKANRDEPIRRITAISVPKL